MAQRLLLEGTNIDELLERVRVEHGPEAKIVHAEQKLVGGVGGFFARRRYEVAVALEDEVGQHPAAQPSTAQLSTRVPRPDPAQEVALMSALPDESAPLSLEDLLSAADDQDGGTSSSSGRGPGRQVSTELDSFDHLLRDLVARAEPGHDGPRSAPVPFFPPHPVPVVPAAVDLADLTAFGGRTANASWSPEQPVFVPSTPPVMSLPAASAVPDALSAFLAQSQSQSQAQTPVADVGPALEGPDPADVRETERPQYTGRHSSAARDVDAGVGTWVSDAWVNDAAVPHAASKPVPRSALDLGMPVADGGHPPADERTALLDVLADVAVPAPKRLHGSTVVVGDAAHARDVAQQLVARTGTHGDAVVLADEHAPSELAAEVERRGRQHGAVVVVVGAGTTRAQARAAGRLVADLGADSVVAVVDATRDVEVVRSWIGCLQDSGAPVRQLAAYDVEESTAPLRLLGLGAPVAWLDARPATLGTWAAVCLDRL